MLLRQAARLGQVFAGRGDSADRAQERFDDETTDPRTQLVELPAQVVQIVEPRQRDLGTDALRQPLAFQLIEGSAVGRDSLQAEGLAAVPPARNLQHAVASGERPRQHHRVEGGQRAAGGQANCLGTGSARDPLGHLGLDLVHHPALQTAAVLEYRGQRVADQHRVVPQHIGEMALPVVEQALPIQILDRRARGPARDGHERIVPADGVAGPVQHAVAVHPVVAFRCGKPTGIRRDQLGPESGHCPRDAGGHSGSIAGVARLVSRPPEISAPISIPVASPPRWLLMLTEWPAEVTGLTRDGSINMATPSVRIRARQLSAERRE